MQTTMHCQSLQVLPLLMSGDDILTILELAEPGSPSGSSSMQFSQARVSLFRSLLSFDGLPKMRPKPSRRNTSEGLLAPHSPNPPRSPLPPPSPSNSRFSSMPPLRSPGPRHQELDAHFSSNQNFQLNTPPRRATPIRRQTGATLGPSSDALGLGLRRSSSYGIMEDNNMLRDG